MSETQPPPPPNADKLDPQLESLLARSRPIIAEERGLNHRSRVKIQALARRMKIPSAVVDQALQLLHGAPPRQMGKETSSGETHYERAFARNMRKKIQAIPGGILTTKIEEKAISVGTRKYQLSETQARNLVRRVAEEVGVQRVSLTEAERHIEQEIADVVGDDTWITGDKKERLIRNGKRLGVTPEQTDSMIQRHLQFNFQQVQFERKLTDRLWIVAACIVVGTGLALFVFFQVRQANKENESIEKSKLVKEENKKKKKQETDNKSDSPEWWDDSLKLLLQKTRLRVNEFPAIHDKLKSKRAADRANAYAKLFDIGSGKVNPRLIRQRITPVLPRLFVSEPDDKAITGMLNAFKRVIQIPPGKVPESVDFFNRAFWALDSLNQIVGDKTLSNERVEAIQEMIEGVTGRRFDLFLPEEERLDRQKLALVESYFKELGDLVSAFPSRVPELFEVLTDLVSDDFSEEKVQQLRVDFLMAYLRSEEELWDNCSRLISTAIRESSGRQVGFFIDLMENTRIEPLQLFLEDALLQRAGLGSSTDSINEMAERLRDYFDLNKPADDKPEISRLAQIHQLTREFSDRWLERPQNLNNRDSAQLMVESAYLTTLVWVARGRLTIGRLETLDQLLEAGFPNLNDPDYLNKATGAEWSESGESSETGSIDEAPLSTNEQYRIQANELISSLNQFRILPPERRQATIVRLGQLANQMRRLDEGSATILAEYLFSRKRPTEQQEVLRSLPKMKHWVRLHLALADFLDNKGLPQKTCQEIASQLVGRPIDIPESQWEKKLAQLLKEHVRQVLVNRAQASQLGKDPVRTLYEVITFFWRIRASELSIATSNTLDTDIEHSIDRILEELQGKLAKGGNKAVVGEIAKRRVIATEFEGDVLSRLSIGQAALLFAFAADRNPGGPKSDQESIRKLENLLNSRVRKIDTIVGQIVENEIRILLFKYSAKLN